MEVKLKKNGWHSKLQKWTFGSKAPNFSSLCPYFWTTVFCVMASPFVASVKYLIILPINLIINCLFYVFRKLSEAVEALISVMDIKVCQPIYDKRISSFVDTLDDRGAFELYAILFDVYEYNGKISKPSTAQIKDKWFDNKREKLYKTHLAKFKQWSAKAGSNWENIIIAQVKEEELRREEYAKVLRELENKKELQKKRVAKVFNSIAYYTKYLVYLFVGVIGVYALYFLSLFGLFLYEVRKSIAETLFNFIGWVWHTITNYGLMVLGVAACLMLAVVALFFIIKLIAKCNLFHAGHKPGKFSKVMTKVADGVYNFISFFVIYAKAAKQNYCPKIDWEE